MNGEPALEMLSNVSQTSMVQQIIDTDGKEFAFLGIPSSERNEKVDYTATTFGLQSQCQAITSDCITHDNITGPGAKYRCGATAMEGFIASTKVDTMIQTYFTNSSLADNTTRIASLPNPYYFGTVMSVNQNLGSPGRLKADPNVQSGMHGATIIVFLCNTTVFDWKYTSINGSIAYFSGTRSNASTTNIAMGTHGYTQIGDPYILSRTSLDVWQSHTAQEVADKFASTYSQAALAAFGSAVTPSPATEAQSRSSTLVAKVPKAPLICLLLANLLLVFFGVVLASIAFLTLDNEVGDVQARLSINSLVAAQFEAGSGEYIVEKVDDMFQELKGEDGPHVGVRRTAFGSWKLFSYQSGYPSHCFISRASAEDPLLHKVKVPK